MTHIYPMSNKLGSGYSASVYATKHEKVIRVSDIVDPTNLYHQLCLYHHKIREEKPMMLKVYSMIVKNYSMFTMMERLEHIDTEEQKTNIIIIDEDMEDYISNLLDIDNMDNNSSIVLELLIPCIEAGILDQFHLDLHDSNFMLRPNGDLVLTDPFSADYEEDTTVDEILTYSRKLPGCELIKYIE